MDTELKAEEKIYMYWLCRQPLIGGLTVRRLWERFGRFEYIYNIEGKELAAQGLLNKKSSEVFEASKKYLGEWRAEYEEMGSRGIRFVTFLDGEYPGRLTHIFQAPAGLFVKGGLPEEGKPAAAVVGARDCSNYGLQAAEYTGKVLSGEGIQVISGLARGVDGAGHRGALQAGGGTYGVLGCGVDICYPSQNRSLYRSMAEEGGGGVLSEYPPGTQAKPQHFPMRNRIISGLADVIIVIEARERSGSLITAELGLEQGKEVYALPGRITDSLSEGCNQLIKDGASILTSPYDVVEYFGLKSGKMLRVHEKNQNGLAKKEKMVYSCLDLQPKFVEQIVEESGLSVSECMAVLLRLELGGWITEVSHQYYGKKL